MATTLGIMLLNQHRWFFYLFLSCSLCTASSALPQSESATKPPTECLNVVCTDPPGGCNDKNSRFKKCANNVFHKTKECDEPYNTTGHLLYIGYQHIQDNYCANFQLSKSIDELVSAKCWNTSVLCLARNLGIDSGVQLDKDSCTKAWINLQGCWKNQTVKRCSSALEDAAYILYGKINCGGSPARSETSTIVSLHFAAQIVMALLLTLMLI